MTKYILALTLFFSTDLLGQRKIGEILEKINTVKQAENFERSNPKIDCELLNLNSEVDVSVTAMVLLTSKRGDILRMGKYSYRILSDTTENFYRASYIYLDGSKLTFAQIDSIRQIIISKYKSGIKFEDLFVEYNMDGNDKFGDTGNFGEKMMIQEFETAVRQHSVDEVFFVNISSKKWYYVVKKTYPDKQTRKVLTFRIRSGS